MSKNVAMTYGRFNPPTNGHELVYNRVISVPNSKGYIFASSKTGDPKNPLTGDEKIVYLKKMFKAATVEIVAGGYIEAFKKVSPANKLTIVVGEDRIDVVEKLANKYNHKEYNFDQIEVIDAGSRSGNAMSASKMRAWAIQGDFEHFKLGCSKKLNDQEKQQLYDLVRSKLL